HALGFDHRDHLLDLLRVELDPAVVAEFVEAVRGARGLLGRCHRWCLGIVGLVQFGVDGLVLRLGRGVGLAVGWLGIAFGAGVLLLALLVGGLVALVGLVSFVRLLGLAHRDAVVEAEHHHDDVGFLGREDALGGRGPVGGIALGLIADQARCVFC